MSLSILDLNIFPFNLIWPEMVLKVTEPIGEDLRDLSKTQKSVNEKRETLNDTEDIFKIL